MSPHLLKLDNSILTILFLAGSDMLCHIHTAAGDMSLSLLNGQVKFVAFPPMVAVQFFAVPFFISILILQSDNPAFSFSLGFIRHTHISLRVYYSQWWDHNFQFVLPLCVLAGHSRLHFLCSPHFYISSAACNTFVICSGIKYLVSVKVATVSGAAPQACEKKQSQADTWH